MKDIMRMCSGVFYDPMVQTQVVDVLRSKATEVYKQLMGVTTDQEWYGVPMTLKMDGSIIEERGDGVETEDIELDAQLNIAKRYTHNGCNVDLELIVDKLIGVACIPDMAFEELTGISLVHGDHYEFAINLCDRAGYGVLSSAVVAEKLATAISDGWWADTDGFDIETEVPALGTVVISLFVAPRDTNQTAVDKFNVVVKCVNGDDEHVISDSWFYRDEVA